MVACLYPSPHHVSEEPRGLRTHRLPLRNLGPNPVARLTGQALDEGIVHTQPTNPDPLWCNVVLRFTPCAPTYGCLRIEVIHNRHLATYQLGVWEVPYSSA